MSQVATFYVYRVLDDEGSCLYVGAAADVFRRLAQHRTQSAWFASAVRLDVTIHATHREALDVERAEINRLQPPGNASHPNILINDREWLSAQRDAGLTVQEIADLAEVTKCRVQQALKAHGLVRYTRPELAHPLLADRQWLSEAIVGGPTLDELSELASASKMSVRSYLSFHGLHDSWRDHCAQRSARNKNERTARARRPGRPPQYPQLRDIEWLVDAVRERGCMAVSREIGCHVSSVMRALERNGYTSNHIYARWRAA